MLEPRPGPPVRHRTPDRRCDTAAVDVPNLGTSHRASTNATIRRTYQLHRVAWMAGCLSSGEVPGTRLDGLAAALRRTTTNLSTAPLACAVVLGREVLGGVVNGPRIDGKDGVAGSIWLGLHTAAWKGWLRAWGSRLEPRCMV